MLIPPFTSLDLSQFNAESVIVHPDLEEERGVERGSSLKDERRPSSVRRTLDLFQRQPRKLLRDGMERVWAFPSAQIPP